MRSRVQPSSHVCRSGTGYRPIVDPVQVRACPNSRPEPAGDPIGEPGQAVVRTFLLEFNSLKDVCLCSVAKLLAGGQPLADSVTGPRHKVRRSQLCQCGK